MLRRKNKGFTLIEIIVVLIILGVIAAIAVPSYFNWVERSRSAEASIYIKSLKDTLEGCLAIQGVGNVDVSTCLSSVQSPRHFITGTIFDSINSGSATVYGFRVLRNNVDLAQDPFFTSVYNANCGGSTFGVQGSVFYICRSNNGSYTIQGFGLYQGIY